MMDSKPAGSGAKLPRSSVSALKTMEQDFLQSKKLQLTQFLKDQEQITEQLRKCSFHENSDSTDASVPTQITRRFSTGGGRPLSARTAGTSVNNSNYFFFEDQTSVIPIPAETRGNQDSVLPTARKSSTSSRKPKLSTISIDSDDFCSINRIAGLRRPRTSCEIRSARRYLSLDEDEVGNINDDSFDNASITSVCSDNAACDDIDDDVRHADILNSIFGPPIASATSNPPGGRRRRSEMLGTFYTDRSRNLSDQGKSGGDQPRQRIIRHSSESANSKN